MTTAKAPLPYLERRPGGFLYRRRIPDRVAPALPAVGSRSAPREEKSSARFFRLSLCTHVPSEARILAMRLTALFDLAFALVTERTMDHLRPDQIEMLEALARFQIAAHAAARAAAPAHSEAAARHAAACEAATQAVLRRALATGDRELARQPLREVATCMGVALEEDTEDWNRLAFEATRVLLDASHLRERQELGQFEEPSPVFHSARARMNGAGRQPAPAWSLPAVPASFAPAAVAPAAVALPVTQPITHAVPATPAPLAPAPVAAAPLAPAAVALPVAPPVNHAVPTAPLVPLDPPVPPVSQPHPDAARDPVLALRLQTRPPKLANIPLDRLSPAIRQALREKPRGLSVIEGIQFFDEMKTLGYGNEFGQLQAADPVAGANWVRDSRSKTRFALQFWPEFVGDGPFEEVDAGEIRDALEALPQIPAKHSKGVQGWGPQHSFVDLIERSDAWEEHTGIANLARLTGAMTEVDREKAVLEAREPRLRAETVIKHRRHIKAVGEMLLALQLVDVNPFAVCAVSGKQEDRMKKAEEGRGLPPPSGPVRLLVHDGRPIHRDQGFGGWRAVSEGAVRADGVVVDAPLLDDDPGLADGVEDLAVEQFVPEPGIEALDVAVLPG